MKHMNGHILCAITMKVSGPIAGHHEMLEICILPLDPKLDYFRGIDRFRMFNCQIRPQHPNRHEMLPWTASPAKVADSYEHGIDAELARDQFEQWFDKMNLGHKNILPLGYDLQRFWPFMRAWLGPRAVEHYFSNEWRDVMVIAQYMRDRSSFDMLQCPFVNSTFPEIARKLEIPDQPEKKLQDAAYDAMLIAQMYDKMIGWTYL